jgi:hypothetical protein
LTKSNGRSGESKDLFRGKEMLIQIQPIISEEKVWMLQKKRYDKLDRR